MAIVYRSKIDTSIAVILIVGVVVSVAGSVTALSFAPPLVAWPIALSVVAVGAGLPSWLLATTYYRIDDKTLFISSGPIRERVPIREIVGVTPTRNPVSSPALSLDRLRIDYGRGKSVLISPRDKEDFLRSLKSAGCSAV